MPEKKQGYNALAIANIFVQKALDGGGQPPLTIMALVKYVYLAHGWTLGYTGNPLIEGDDPVEAWKYGPVIPIVYKEFRPQGTVINKLARDKSGNPYPRPPLDEMERDIIDEVYSVYSKAHPFKLSELTHGYGTPWREYFGKPYASISNRLIEEHYQKIIAERQKKRKQQGGQNGQAA